MRVVRVSIRNFMGIEELDFEAGAFNVITAKNGQGKTSFIEAIKAVVRGGDDATLLRKGEKRGEVVLLLDDGTRIARRLTEKGVQPLVIERDGHKVQQPASVMKELADIIAVNPVEFLRARKKERVDILLESLPINVDRDALSVIVGHPITLNPRLTPFEQVDFLRESIFDERTGTNRALKEKRATIDQLMATIPDDYERWSAEDESGLLAEINRIDGERDTEFARIDAKLALLQEGYERTVADIRQNADTEVHGLLDEIAALERQIADKKATISEARVAAQQATANETSTLAEMKDRAAKQRQITTEKHGADRSGVAAQLEAIRARTEEYARVKTTKDTIERMSREADALDSDAQRQTASITGIDTYKSDLLASLPVPGLEVRGGEIIRNGIVFDRLNTAQQIAIAVEIAKARAGELRIVCVDGIEMLDEQNFAEFRRQIIESGLQAFVARVGDENFNLAASA